MKPGSLLYIGKTEGSQLDRDLKEHFSTGRTGSSTLRRSLGAVLLDELKLRPMPRSQTERSNRRYRNYSFEAGGDEELTKWMKRNIGLSFHEYPRPEDEIERLERTLI